MQEDTVVRELVCELNDTELLERADAIAHCELKADELKAERRRLNAQLREQTDRRGELAGVIDSKRETREVTCKWRPDYKAKCWLLVRTDTKETIDQRAMSEADLQRKLPLSDADAVEPVAPPAKRKRAAAAAPEAAAAKRRSNGRLAAAGAIAAAAR